MHELPEASEEPSPTVTRRLLHLAGLDRAVAWSVASRVAAALFGPITITLLASRLTAEEQGFYFAFSSLTSVQVLVDAGASAALLPVVSHEMAHLERTARGTVTGAEESVRRLGSVVQTLFRGYAFASIFLALVLAAGGFLFFGQVDSASVAWRMPWLVVAIATGAALIVNPLTAVLEGCGDVAAVARIRVEQATISQGVLWLTLLLGGGLWGAAASSTCATLFVLVRIGTRWAPFFQQMLAVEPVATSWRSEVWPLQWRAALGFTSTTLAMQSLTPLLLLFQGAAAAGRMGLSIALAGTLLNIAIVWLLSKRPQLSMHVARRERVELDRVFLSSFARGAFVMVAGSIALCLGLLLLRAIKHPWSERLLAPLPLAALLAGFCVTYVVWAQSAWLRAHKDEALMRARVLGAACICCASLLLIPRYGEAGAAYGFTGVSLTVLLGGTTYVFLRRRRMYAE